LVVSVALTPPQFPFLMHDIQRQTPIGNSVTPKQERMLGTVLIERMPRLVWFPNETHPS